MKKLLLILMILSNAALAQKKKITLSEEKIFPFTKCSYSKTIDVERADTLYYVYIGFQNAKYTHISDIQSIMFTKQWEVDEFIKDLNSALTEMEVKGSEVSWDRQNYSLNKYNFSEYIYIKSTEGGYTTIDKKVISKLTKWLSTINIGEE